MYIDVLLKLATQGLGSSDPSTAVWKCFESQNPHPTSQKARRKDGAPEDVALDANKGFLTGFRRFGMTKSFGLNERTE